MGELSKKSVEKMAGVHPDLQRLVIAAAAALPFQLMVVEGVRSDERQRQLYAQGRTTAGKVVTWSLDSRHKIQRCGYGCAVDLAPVNDDGSIPWNDSKKFLAIGKAMLTAAIDSGIKIRWGYDWDGDGKLQEKGEYDGPHFELARDKYP